MQVVTDYTALMSGDSWNGLEMSNTPAVVTYSFAAAAPADDANYMGAAFSTFQSLTDTEKADVRAALAEWAAASGLQFVEVPAGASDITFSTYDFTTSPYNGYGGLGNYPFGDWNYFSYPNFLDSAFPGSGDVMLNRVLLSGGHFDHGLLLHEIGHALGLKHPTQDFMNYASGVDHDQELATDDGTATVMTQKTGGPESLTTLDIAAIQHLYGTNAQDGSEYAAWSYDSGLNRFTFDALAGGGNVRGSSVDDIVNGSASADTIFALGGNDVMHGFAGADTLFGGSGNDVLDGGAGADTMYGGKGNDTFYVTDTTDVVSEFAGEGTDTVSSSITWTLGANVENLALTGTANIDGTGNELGNILTGNAGNNTLLGGDGNDVLRGLGGNDTLDGQAGGSTLYGGAGNDTYIVRTTADLVSEQLVAGTDDGGVDLVQSAISYGLPAYVENLVLTGSANINGSGNGLGNAITGNSGNNQLAGNGGNDMLDGGAGVNYLYGGAGNDTYVVGSTTDHVLEIQGGVDQGGTDTVLSSINYGLPADVENLTLSGSANLNGSGNGLGNVITGNSGNNQLAGLSGDDTLDGGAGVNYLYGGAGNDTYIVGSTTDHVLEIQGGVDQGGTDTVLSSISYILPVGVENLTLSGSAAINGTGTAQNNVITGNSGDNSLSGLGGNDTLDGGAGVNYLYGGAGNDTYYVNSADDHPIEQSGGVDAGGTDTVVSDISYKLGAFVENLTLAGTANIDATGNNLDNVLTGNSGNNVLEGRVGNDTFVLGSAASNGLDHITDFTSGSDKLEFHASDYGFAAHHVLQASEISFTGAAVGSNAQFVYSTATHTLSWDANGSTAAGITALVVFDNGATPATGDFLFV